MPCNLLQAARYQRNGSKTMYYRFTMARFTRTSLVCTRDEVYFGTGLY
ncbi:hypothetical protein [Endozoicomonas sp. GU-1]|nr:hypothetical protein [Endozoicomonas sp. GU-1]WBA80616.1 hypothetical protein O2T12_20175 [Endozoicomonas sp. GU-1]WBA88186.1 hypothetical protein O3276_09395 [Endozoicomonas sp. GU-1]